MSTDIINDNFINYIDNEIEKSNNVLSKFSTESLRSSAIQVLSDSTANDPIDWVYQLVDKIKADYPNHSIKYKLYNDALKSYEGDVVIQTGAAGQRYLDGSTGILAPKFKAVKYISGKMDIKAKFSLSDWTPTENKAVAGCTGAEGKRGWECGISSIIGRPYFTWYSDGTVATIDTMYCFTPPTIADGEVLWMRWVFNPNDGSGYKNLTVYTSNNGYAWTPLETPNVVAGTTTIFNNTGDIKLECGGAASVSTGLKLYEIHILDGDTGEPIAPYLPDLWDQADDLNRTLKIVGAPILTIVNGSIPGASIDYLMNAERKHTITPDYGQITTFIALSHNEGSLGNLEWMNKLDTMVNFIKAKFPLAEIVIMTQNPQTSAAAGNICHTLRRLDTLKYAKVKNLQVVDIYKLFIDNPNWSTELMNDAVHPNAAGGLLIANKIYSTMSL